MDEITWTAALGGVALGLTVAVWALLWKKTVWSGGLTMIAALGAYTWGAPLAAAHPALATLSTIAAAIVGFTACCRCGLQFGRDLRKPLPSPDDRARGQAELPMVLL